MENINFSKELVGLKNEAEALADIFWSKHHEIREDKKRIADRGHWGVRVRDRQESLSIEWFWNFFYKDKKGACKVTANSVPKGPKSQYPFIRFQKRITKSWEYEIIHELEPKFAIIREKARALGKLKRAYSYYNRAINKINIQQAELENGQS